MVLRLDYSSLLGRLLALALALGATGSARADEAADHHAAAVALLDQLHPADAVNAMMPNIINSLRLNLTHNDPDLVKAFNDFAPALAAEGEVAKPALIDRIVDIYAKTFTTDELKAIEAFYKSPAGAKVIATQGQVTTDTINVVRDWGTTLAHQMADEARAKLQSRQP
jgi:hypothetical protein